VLWVLPDVDWQAPWPVWGGFIYVALFSQLIGFFAWNRGLALGGVARVGQVQLLQLFMTLAASAWLLGEDIDWVTIIFAVGVVGVVAARALDCLFYANASSQTVPFARNLL